LGPRVYDPLAGRFLAPDPVFQLGSQFSYTAGNPVTWWDPSGYDAVRNAQIGTAVAKLGVGVIVLGVGLTASLAGPYAIPVQFIGIMLIINGSFELLDIANEVISQRSSGSGSFGAAGGSGASAGGFQGLGTVAGPGAGSLPPVQHPSPPHWSPCTGCDGVPGAAPPGFGGHSSYGGSAGAFGGGFGGGF
jgi:hypothetical protein